MASIFDYISDNLNRFKFLKWVQIIKTESEATKRSALYLLEKSSTAFEVIVTDDSGAKRKLTGGVTGTGIQSIQEGDNISIDNTDPLNPIVSATGGGTAEESYIEITKSELDTHITNSTLVPNTLYKVSWVHTSFHDEDNSFELGALYNDGVQNNGNGGVEIFVRALTTNTIDTKAVGIFYNPKYNLNDVNNGQWDNRSSFTLSSYTGTFVAREPITADNGATGLLFNLAGDGDFEFIILSGDWDSATSIVGDNSGFTANIDFVIVKTYSIDDTVCFGGYVWKNLNGNVGDIGASEMVLNEEWEKVPFTDLTKYNIVYDEIEYDYIKDHIVRRKDKYGNDIFYDLQSAKYVMENYDTPICHGLVGLPWGFEDGIHDDIYKMFRNNVLINSQLILNSTLKIYSFYANSGNDYYINSNSGNGYYIYYNSGNDYNINFNSGNDYNIYTNSGNNYYINTNSGNGYYVNSNSGNNYYVNSNSGNNYYVNSNIGSSITISQNGLNYLKIEYYTFNNTKLKNNTGAGFYLQGDSNNRSTHDLSYKTISLLDVNLNASGNNYINTLLNSATILYGDYNKRLFQNSSGILRLSYFNENDVLVIADITD